MFGSWVFSLSEFKEHAEMGSQFEWCRTSYTHVKAIIDKNGQIQKIIDEKGKIPKNKIPGYVAKELDDYLNYFSRSLKCVRDGNYVGARLKASRSIPYLLNSIFGLEGRPTPYYKYVEWELKEFPLKKFTMRPDELIKNILKILEDADPKTQLKIFNAMEKVFRKEGYSKVFDAWKPDGTMKFIKSFKN
jgi:hypothetical protein